MLKICGILKMGMHKKEKCIKNILMILNYFMSNEFTKILNYSLKITLENLDL